MTDVRVAALPLRWLRGGPYDEAYYENEASARMTPGGTRYNRFTDVGTLRYRVRLSNPILEAELSDDRVERVRAAGWHMAPYNIYVAPGTSSAGPIKLTLLFAVGSELKRFGLRSLFQQPGRALILVPGIEAGWFDNPLADLPRPRAWGRGVDGATIDALLAEAGFGGSSWSVEVIAGYSTGYRGLNGTVLHATTTPAALDLSQVKRVAIYDCLYRGDEPAPGRNTMRALSAIEQHTRGRIQLYIYEVTPAGTPRRGGDTLVSQQWLRDTFGARYHHIDLRKLHRPLQALLCCRFLEVANGDGYLRGEAGDLSDRFRTPALQHVARLLDTLPERWTLASTATPFIRGTLALSEWARMHADDIKKMFAFIAHKDFGQLRFNQRQHSFPTSIQFINNALINRFNLAGWIADIGERLHDSFIPEFGHEVLRGELAAPDDIYADVMV